MSYTFVTLVGSRLPRHLDFTPANKECPPPTVSADKTHLDIYGCRVVSLSGTDAGKLLSGDTIPANKFVKLQFGTVTRLPNDVMIHLSRDFLEQGFNLFNTTLAFQASNEAVEITLVGKTERAVKLPQGDVLLSLYVLA